MKQLRPVAPLAILLPPAAGLLLPLAPCQAAEPITERVTSRGTLRLAKGVDLPDVIVDPRPYGGAADRYAPGGIITCSLAADLQPGGPHKLDMDDGTFGEIWIIHVTQTEQSCIALFRVTKGLMLERGE